MIIRIIIFVGILFLFSCDAKPIEDRPDKPVYVKPSIDKRGRFRKGHIRKPVSTSKNAVKNRNRSKYYYKTRGKYRKKSKKD